MDNLAKLLAYEEIRQLVARYALRALPGMARNGNA